MKLIREIKRTHPALLAIGIIGAVYIIYRFVTMTPLLIQLIRAYWDYGGIPPQ